MSTYVSSTAPFPIIEKPAPLKKDWLDVTAGFAEDPFTFAKTVYVAIDCIDEFFGIPDKHQEVFSDTRYTFNLIKLTRGPGEFLKFTNRLRHRAVDVYNEGGSLDSMKKLVRAAHKCVGPVSDIASFLTKAILFIPKHAVATLDGVSYYALAFGMSWNACESISTIAFSTLSSAKGKEREAELFEVKKAMLHLAKEVAYIAMGVISVLAIFFGIIVTSSAFDVALSATTVALTIIIHYYENLGELITPKRIFLPKYI